MKPKFKHCPFCAEKDTLEKGEKTLTKIKGNKIVKGIFEVWTCNKCGEGFFYRWKFETEKK